MEKATQQKFRSGKMEKAERRGTALSWRLRASQLCSQETYLSSHILQPADNNRVVTGIITQYSYLELLHLYGILLQASQRIKLAKIRVVYLETGFIFLLAYKQSISVT